MDSRQGVSRTLARHPAQRAERHWQDATLQTGWTSASNNHPSASGRRRDTCPQKGVTQARRIPEMRQDRGATFTHGSICRSRSHWRDTVSIKNKGKGGIGQTALNMRLVQSMRKIPHRKPRT